MSSVRIHLDQQAIEPGDEIRGVVEWDLVDRQASSLLISLLWHTEGKGTEDSETVDQHVVSSPGISGRQAFAFRLPSVPWSFSGQLISLIWTIEANLEGTDMFQSAAFVCAPNAREVRLSRIADS